jgi:hypothetical protein
MLELQVSTSTSSMNLKPVLYLGLSVGIGRFDRVCVQSLSLVPCLHSLYCLANSALKFSTFKYRGRASIALSVRVGNRW